VIWCLHGFLGLGADWDALRAACAAAGHPAIRTPSLFAPRGVAVPARGSLTEWGAAFAAHVAAADPTPIVIGYSLGGRLALHALLARPALWRGAVIVSAHLGLADAAARAARRAHDAAWARRFRDDAWDRVLADWDARDVFGGRPQRQPRPEAAYDRTALAAALEDWSLGTQPPLTDRLDAIPCPVLWVTGADDPRYVAQGDAAVHALPRGALRAAPGAGHRVPWEAERWFADEVVGFLKTVE